MRDFFNKVFSIQNKFFISTLIAVVTMSIIALLQNFLFWSVLTSVNLNFQNNLFTSQYLVGNKNLANKLITVIEIDDKTVKDKDKWGLWRWQEMSLKRSVYAKAINNLKKDGAIVIWMDILFSEKSELFKEEDNEFAKTIKSAGNVVLSFHKMQWLYPIKSFSDVAYGLWDVFALVNRVNKTVYSIYPYYDDDFSESLTLSVLKKYYSELYWKEWEWAIESHPGYFDFYWIRVPFAYGASTWKSNEMLINYTIDQSWFQKISFIDVYNWKYNPNLVKGKIVLIWSSVTAVHDEYNTPLWILPWVYTHVNAVNTILNKSFIRYFDSGYEILLLMLFVYLITLLWVYDRHKYYFIASLFILFVAYFKFYNFAFSEYNIILRFPAYFYLWIVLSFLFVNLYRYLYEDKWKRLLHNALSQYLAEDLVAWVLWNYEKVKLWWKRMESTIFFSDIAGFTSISENMTPEELVEFLSKYLKAVSDTIIDNKWFINKYEWDAVMALWWIFGQEQTQAALACKAALMQQKNIEELNEHFREVYWFEISVRMWLNKWAVVVWNIWSEWKKIEYTALWDNVNLASRLESINKYYWTKICVSESVKNEAWDDFIFRHMDKIKVKWKQNAVDIFELIGFKNEVTHEKIQIVSEFEQALAIYMSWDFNKAKQIFNKLSDLWDSVSGIFTKRCDDMILNNPVKLWDGSWEFSEK